MRKYFKFRVCSSKSSTTILREKFTAISVLYHGVHSDHVRGDKGRDEIRPTVRRLGPLVATVTIWPIVNGRDRYVHRHQSERICHARYFTSVPWSHDKEVYLYLQTNLFEAAESAVESCPEISTR